MLAISYSGLALFFGGIVLSDGKMPYAAFGICGFFVFAVSVILMLSTGRCVQCGRRLGHMFAHHFNMPWRVSSDLRFCPYCGHSLDEPSTDDRDSSHKE
jgi:hypothetical protein